jgi:hypothetical protein
VHAQASPQPQLGPQLQLDWTAGAAAQPHWHCSRRQTPQLHALDGLAKRFVNFMGFSS